MRKMAQMRKCWSAEPACNKKLERMPFESENFFESLVVYFKKLAGVKSNMGPLAQKKAQGVVIQVPKEESRTGR